MPRSHGEACSKIVEAAYDLFFRKGFARVSVDLVAERAGVTKRTLYYHFASKDDLLAAVLTHGHELALARIKRWGERLGDDVDDMLDQLFADLAKWAARPRWEGTGYTRLVMELADLPGHPAREVARRHKQAVEQWLSSEFSRRAVGDAEERARQVMLLLEGCVALMLIHGDRSYAQSAARIAQRAVSGRGDLPHTAANTSSRGWTALDRAARSK
jgi:AcrR family transcriptional regulator